jgi:hypothetical protein
MSKFRNLDVFYDVVFCLDDGNTIHVNSLILQARSDYFRGMLNQNSGFIESVSGLQQSSSFLKMGSVKPHVRYVKVHGITKTYFAAIIQYLYTDHCCVTESEISFYIRMLVYADFFMLDRLVDITSSHLA